MIDLLTNQKTADFLLFLLKATGKLVPYKRERETLGNWGRGKLESGENQDSANFTYELISDTILYVHHSSPANHLVGEIL